MSVILSSGPTHFWIKASATVSASIIKSPESKGHLLYNFESRLSGSTSEPLSATKGYLPGSLSARISIL